MTQVALRYHSPRCMFIKEYKCPICNKCLTGLDSWKNHQLECTQCDICMKKISTFASLLVHRKIHAKRVFCDGCNRPFSSTKALNLHKRMSCRAGQRSFCEVCQKYVTRIEAHNQNVHWEKRYNCDICEKAFTTTWILKYHKQMHTRPYSCTICGDTFGYAPIYERHMRKHTGEKQFQCDMCNKKFSRRDNLFTHLRSHAGKFKCVKCKVYFTSKHGLDQHTKSKTACVG